VFLVLMEEWGSLMVGHSGKCWAFLCLREAGLLAPREWQITTQRRSWVPTLWKEVGALPLEGFVVHSEPLCSVGGGKPLGTSAIANHWAWGSLVCLTVGFWHWVASWGWPWGSKAAWNVWYPLSSRGPRVYLYWGMGFQEPRSCCRNGRTKP
jgi:hypothetical protein